MQEVKVERYGKEGLAFRINAPKRTYEFRATSPDDVNGWIESINHASDEARTGSSGSMQGPGAPEELEDMDDLFTASKVGQRNASTTSTTSVPPGAEEVTLASTANQSSGDGDRKKFGLRNFLKGVRDNNRQTVKPALPPPMESLSSWTDITLGNSVGDQPPQGSRRSVDSNLEEMPGDDYERPARPAGQSADL